ncbi:MAG: NEW3 domain-containing protein [Chloroflexi bacterium]|nr:NEW3 domain-containing protein [Chloroflexota bacterium]
MKRLSFICVLSLLMSLVVAALTPLSMWAADPDVVLSTTYPSITAGKGQDITFPIDVINRGKSDERLDLSVVSAPKGWETTLKDRGYGVRSLYLLAGKTQSFTLQVKPSEDAAVGNQKIVLQAASSDGSVKSTLELNVGLEAKPLGGVKLATIYPVLRGPSTSKFQFQVDVTNQGDDERTVGLATAQPQDWQVTVQPSYDQKQISSMRLKGGETKSVDVQITPSAKAQPGEYNIDLQATAGNAKDALRLKVALIGTTELSLETSTGRLNMDATAGQPSPISVVVTNKGSADLRNITFSSSKADGWEVTFNPNKIDTLAAGQSQEVNVTVKPSGKAIAGDYAVSLTASSGSASDKAQLRVTVETSTLWGWTGIALVVIVIGGLGGLFLRLGRR